MDCHNLEEPAAVEGGGGRAEAELVARVADRQEALAREEDRVAEKRACVARAEEELSSSREAEVEAEVKRARVAKAWAKWASSLAKLEAGKAQAKRKRKEVAKAERKLAHYRAMDWAGLPANVLEVVAEKVVSQHEAGWEARRMENLNLSEEQIQEEMAKRKRDGNCLFPFARVCREWRQAQVAVGGPLRTRVYSDVAMPGQVALAKWALAEGCPREIDYEVNMATVAAEYGHLELVKWLCGEGGFAMDENVMMNAAHSGNLQLVQWLRAEGCPWDDNGDACHWAVSSPNRRVEVLRWLRENGCPWRTDTREDAWLEFEYTDDLGNLIDSGSDSVEDDDEYSDEYSDADVVLADDE